MSARKRRTPLGTQPPVTSEPPREVAGEIQQQPDAALEAHKKALDADQEHSVIVQIDDDWLARLDLPID